MKEQNYDIYNELVKKYNSNSYTEDKLLMDLNDKPLCVHINALKSQYDEIMHHHEYYEILYIEKGSINYIINDQQYTLLPGDLILISPTTLHRLVSFESNESSRYILLFSERFLHKFSTKNTNLFEIFNNAKKNNMYKLSFNDTQKIELERNLISTSTIMLEDSFGADLIYIQKFLKTIIFLTDASIHFYNEKTILTNSNNIVDQISRFINNNISYKIVIEDIAKYLALSTSRISHIFKKETGISILKYINKKRMILAKELIKKGETFINIASQCGFQDYTSFFRTFKKEFGITPGDYSKKIRLFDD